MKNIVVQVFWTTALLMVSVATIGSLCYLLSMLRHNIYPQTGMDILKQLYLLSAVISVTYTWAILIMMHIKLQKK